MEVVALLRDIVIIVVGLIWIVAGVIVAIIAFLTWRFVRTLPSRVDVVTAPAQELLGQARRTLDTTGEGARTAKEAIAFVTEKAVVPTIGVTSAVIGLRRFLEVLLSGAGRGRTGD